MDFQIDCRMLDGSIRDRKRCEVDVRHCTGGELDIMDKDVVAGCLAVSILPAAAF